jgi:hypothetical protein
MTLAILAFAGISRFVIAMQQSPPSPPQPSAPMSNEKQNDSDGKTPVSKSGESPIVRTPPGNDSAKDQSRDHVNEPAANWSLIFAGIVAVGAVVQIFSVFVQTFFIRKQLRLTKQSADAATQSVQSIKVLNRARIVFDKLKFSDFEDASKETFYFAYIVENKGGTIARIFETADAVIAVEGPLPDTPSYEETTKRTSHVSIGPGQKMTYTLRDFKKSDFDMEKFANEQSELYAIGFIRYRDEFGTEWITSYARQYARDGAEAYLVTKAGYNDAT